MSHRGIEQVVLQLWRLAKDQNKSGFMHLLSSVSFPSQVPGLIPKHLAMYTYSLTILGLREQNLWSQIESRWYQLDAQTIPARDLANIVWGFAKNQDYQRNIAFWRNLENTTLRTLSECEPKELSTIIYSFAHVGYKSPVLWKSLAERVAVLHTRMNPKDLSMITCALSNGKLLDVKTWDVLRTAILTNLTQFEPGHLSSIINSLAKNTHLTFLDEVFLERIESFFIKQLKRIAPKDVVRTAWTYLKRNQGSEKFWQHIESYYISRSRDMDPADFALFVWIFSKRGPLPDPIFKAVLLKSTEAPFVRKLILQDLLNIGWSIFHSGIDNPLIWKNLGDAFRDNLKHQPEVTTLKFASHICYLAQRPLLLSDDGVKTFYARHIARLRKTTIADLEDDDRFNILDMLLFYVKLSSATQETSKYFETLLPCIEYLQHNLKTPEEFTKYFQLIATMPEHPQVPNLQDIRSKVITSYLCNEAFMAKLQRSYESFCNLYNTLHTVVHEPWFDYRSITATILASRPKDFNSSHFTIFLITTFTDAKLERSKMTVARSKVKEYLDALSDLEKTDFLNWAQSAPLDPKSTKEEMVKKLLPLLEKVREVTVTIQVAA